MNFGQNDLIQRINEAQGCMQYVGNEDSDQSPHSCSQIKSLTCLLAESIDTIHR